ncbi:hypothetical protein Hanom_Chr03g00234471 [Helianthus anomalus]
MGFGIILNLKTDSLPSKLSHFMVDKFRGKEMVIKLDVGNIKLDDDVISGLLGLKNSRVVFELSTERKGKRKEKRRIKQRKTKRRNIMRNKMKKKKKKNNMKKKKKNKMGTKNVGHTLSGPSCMKRRAITPSRIVERIIDNQDEEGIFFKYDFLALFMNTMVEIKTDGTCETEFLKCLGEDIVVEDVNWCKYICDMIKISKDGWQRDNMSIYFNGALTILVMIYADRTVCGDINSIRTMTPL